jgi:hypothetical protein
VFARSYAEIVVQVRRAEVNRNEADRPDGSPCDFRQVQADLKYRLKERQGKMTFL